jgi:peptidoglycan/LPS O-acetylase OafA/YrhL
MSFPESAASVRRKVTVRRAPKYVPFLILGALLGFAAAAVLAYGVPGDESYDAGTVFGFFLVPCAAGGAVLGAVVALVLDRLSLRRPEHAVVEPVPDSGPEAGPENGGGFDGGTGSEPRS